jgi:hypothetical protein
MPDERKWEQLHAIDDDYLEPLRVAEKADGSVTYEVGGETGTSPDADAAKRTAEHRFRKLFPTHVCSRVCSSWVLMRHSPRLLAILFSLYLGDPLGVF